MRVLNFYAERIHGYLDFNIDFNEDLTFLTGRNGCGKTSVLRGISALLTPSFINLVYLSHQVMRVTVEHEGDKLSVESTKNEDILSIKISSSKEIVKIPIYNPAFSEKRYPDQDDEIEFYSQIEQKNIESDVLKKIRDLPNPMFLGLERRATFFQKRPLLFFFYYY